MLTHPHFPPSYQPEIDLKNFQHHPPTCFLMHLSIIESELALLTRNTIFPTFAFIICPKHGYSNPAFFGTEGNPRNNFSTHSSQAFQLVDGGQPQRRFRQGARPRIAGRNRSFWSFEKNHILLSPSTGGKRW